MTLDNDPIFAEAKRIYALGIAPVWLYPGTKQPIGLGWNKGPRKPWKTYVQEYEPGMNLGARLDRASVIDGKFIAVVDCDLKSEDPRHKEEMEAALHQLVNGVSEAAPWTSSGRSNGSKHLWVATLEPVKGKKLAQSAETVPTFMPSVKPSKADILLLGKEKVEEGWRTRVAWQIELLGEGDQVVLPPSVHPDTKKPYVCHKALTRESLVLLPPGLAESAPATRREAVSVDFEEVDVDLSRLRPEVRELITELTGPIMEVAGGDRSKALYRALESMVREGYSDNEILSALTNPEWAAHECAADPKRRPGSRQSQVEWWAPQLAKARAEIDPSRDFSSVEVVEEKWLREIDRVKAGHPRCSLLNVELILRGSFGGVFKRNLFAKSDIHGVKTPWAPAGRAIQDTHLSHMRLWFGGQWGFEPGDKLLIDAINVIADRNSFHPVRDYLETLEWDGRPRIATWLADYMGAVGPPEYLRAISAKTLVAMVARAYKPGIKYDYVLTLEGNQGIGKSTLLKYLASEEWFSDAPLNVGDKDAVLAMRGAWIRELGELSGLRKAEVDQIKEFISRTVDKIRMPYGKIVEDFPRECVYVATCNPHPLGYLRDKSGNRRFWPQFTTRADFERVRRDRDQLFAEARFWWELGEALYLDNPKAAAQAIEEQGHRVQEDVLVERVAVLLAAQSSVEKPLFDPEKFSTMEIMQGLGLRENPFDQGRLGDALRQNGFERRNIWVEKGSRKLWVLKK